MEPWEVEAIAKRVANLRNRKNNLRLEMRVVVVRSGDLWEEYMREIDYLNDTLAECMSERLAILYRNRETLLWNRVDHYQRRLEGQPAVK